MMDEATYNASFATACSDFLKANPGKAIGLCEIADDAWVIHAEREGYYTLRQGGSYSYLADTCREAKEFQTKDDLIKILGPIKMRFKLYGQDLRLGWIELWSILDKRGHHLAYASGCPEELR